MTLQKTRLNLKTILVPLAGIAAFLLYIFVINTISQSGLSQIIVDFQKVNPLYYGLAAVSSLLEMVFFTYSWKTLLDSLSVKLSFLRANLYVFYGNFVDILLPAGSASNDLTRVYLVTKEHGKTRSGLAMASLVIHRFIGMGMNVLILIIGVVLLLNEPDAIKNQFLVHIGGLNYIIALTVAIAAALVVLIVLLTNDKVSAKFINAMIKFSSKISRNKWNLGNLQNNVSEIAQNYHESMNHYKKNMKSVAFSFFLMVITWVFSLTTQYLVFLSLGIPISFGAVAITAGIILVVSAIPFGPFQVGIPDVLMSLLYGIFIGNFGVAAVATLLIRFLTLWLRFILGFVAQQYLELRPMKAPETPEISNPSKN